MKSHLSIFAALLLAPMDALHGANPTSAENSAAKTWANEHLFADQNKFPFSFILAVLAHAKRYVANTIKSTQSSSEQTLPETTSLWRNKSKTCNRRIGAPSGLCGHRHQVVPLPDPRLMVVFRDSALQFHDELKTGPLCSFTMDGSAGWIGTYSDLKHRPPSPHKPLLPHLGETGCPASHQLADGTTIANINSVLTVGGNPSIVSLRFKMSEVNDLAAQASNENPNRLKMNAYRNL
jgi:hypothetical protein